MASGLGDLPASTPAASAAVAQSHGEGSPESPRCGEVAAAPGEGVYFTVGSGVYRAVTALPYERRGDDPMYRPLRIFTQDPAASRQEGSVALVNVPYEPLSPGPASPLFRVDSTDGQTGCRYREIDLDDPAVLIRSGRDPSPSDPLFHQQMVYAVCTLVYAAFRTALGRHIGWGFARETDADGSSARLLVRPYAGHDRNSYYDPVAGELSFGYYRAEETVAGRNLPRGYVFTSLSHDIVAHEVTHALLDGLRACFAVPSGPDVLAFHEAFADLVAIFQHFSYREVVQAAIRQAGTRLEEAEVLTDLARQFGHTTGSARPLRSAVDVADNGRRPRPYDPKLEAHTLGSVLTSAVFDAFLTVFRRKIAPYLRLASGGTGILPVGELPPDLQAILAREASSLASQFLTMCIRAIDYCPPVDLDFGEFLRAVVTADYALVPDDPWGYREAWIEAFRVRGIYPHDVHSLTEDALLWRPTNPALPGVPALSFAELRFAGDPCRPSGVEELRRQVGALGRFLTRPEYLEVFGLIASGDPRLGGDPVDLPRLQSIRSSRRVGPGGQVVFDLVAEVTQRRLACDGRGNACYPFHGGATLILDPQGEFRYIIAKSVVDAERLGRQEEFMFGPSGEWLWEEREGRWEPKEQPFRLLHARRTPAESGSSPPPPT